MSTSARVSIVALAVAGSLAAQVPQGEAIMSNFTNAAPMEGLLLCNRNGTLTPVTGLLAARGVAADLNSIQLDPVDDRVWIGGITASAGRVDTLEITGFAVTNFTVIGNTGNGASISGLAHDANGNAVASSGSISGTGGLFRVDRKTNAITRIVGGGTWTGQAGTCNCVCSDDVGNLYFAVTGAPGTIYSLAPGANGDYTGAPAVVGTVSPSSSSTTISSVEYAPAVGTRPARIWWTTFGTAGTAVGYIPLPAGAAVTVGPIGGNSAPNWIDYDLAMDDFWVVTGGINPDTIMNVDHLGAPVTVGFVPPGGANGSPSAIDVNDCNPAVAKILPQYVPVNGSPFDLEFGTCCPPGHIGGVLLSTFGNYPLVVGLAGADGRLFGKLNNVTWPSGLPGLLTYQAVCFDPRNNTFNFGPLMTWPRN
ncbi:MAG: hypothetical protein IT457_20995 [Planctomycetes bacterium]|nr:hypothetical protein [Planctomycetota bacterium]